MKGRIRALTCTVVVLVLLAATARRSEMVGLPLDVSPSSSTPLSPVELQDLLRRSAYAELTRRIEAAQANADREFGQETTVTQLVAAFESADASLTAAADAWIIEAPGSYAARLVRAAHRLALARTDDDATTLTETALSGLFDDTARALAIHPRLVPARWLQLRASAIGRQAGPCESVAGDALAATPASLEIRVAHIACLDASAPVVPGSGVDRAIAESVRDGVARTGQNSALAVLPGFLAWRQAHGVAPAAAIPLYTQAIAGGGHWLFYRDRARAWLATGHAGEALADAGQGLVLAPDQPDLLMTRASALRQLGRETEFEETVRLVQTLDPTNRSLASEAERAWQAVITQVRASLETGSTDGATLAAIDRTRALFPLTAEASYWRGRAHQALDQPEAAFNDFDRALALDGSHLPSALAIEPLLQARHDWNGIAQRWTAYLSFVPADRLGYLRRAEASRQLGRFSAAALDDAQACELGVTSACH